MIYEVKLIYSENKSTISSHSELCLSSLLYVKLTKSI